jgi:hypothetical protein
MRSDLKDRFSFVSMTFMNEFFHGLNVLNNQPVPIGGLGAALFVARYSNE